MIPPFDFGEVLPPYVGGDPAALNDRSPYEASITEMVERFSTSNERRLILEGLLDYREILRQLGIDTGFQWLGGSFVEDCEAIRRRPPGDVDIVSFVRRPSGMDDDGIWAAFVDAEEAFNQPLIKQRHHCDAYFVELASEANTLVERATYWYGLFSHQRDTARWKGMVRIDLASDDARARAFLNRGGWA